MQTIPRVWICSFALLILHMSCSNDLEKVRINETEELPVAITRDVVLTYSDSARTVSQLSAPLRNDYISDDSRSEFPEGIHLVFYNADQSINTRLSANTGVIWQKSGVFYFSQQVELINEKGSQLFTDELTWDNKQKKIYTTRPIRIIDKNRILTGDGLIADDNFQTYVILIPTGTFHIEE
ncbi:MAG: LPS export ABC transporter periplasmic protein LptC [Candidatus Competibacteraceae bacterium]|nr:LPS export ABC transporter periplasmic protein LptC [Candidatus Competibacteraceae bacterium]